MHTPSSVTRRQFLSGLFSLSVAGFLPRQNDTAIIVLPVDHTLRVNAFIRVLQEQHMRHDDVLHDEQKANLVYAFININPSYHLEEAIAVACSMSYQPTCHIVDEYVRRKKGEASRLPDHPVMRVKAWGVPDTYRVLIFREQINALLAEMTGSSLEYGKQICNEMMIGEVKENNFASFLCEKYQSFNRDEIKAIYDAVLYYAPTGRPYTWCSSMVDRADVLSERQKDGKVARPIL